MKESVSPETAQPALKRVLRPLIPETWRKERGIYLRLGPAAGPAYARLRVMDALGVRSANSKRISPRARSFIFVCFGNIMRSPMAELMFKRALGERNQDGIQVSSAGIHATPGSPAHPRAQIAARELGLSLDHHQSQLLTHEMADQADAILAMDFQNKAELVSLFPEARDKVFMLSAYADGQQYCREIADPYFCDQDGTRQCYAVLQNCIHSLAESLWPAGELRIRRIR